MLSLLECRCEISAVVVKTLDHADKLYFVLSDSESLMLYGDEIANKIVHAVLKLRGLHCDLRACVHSEKVI